MDNLLPELSRSHKARQFLCKRKNHADGGDGDGEASFRLQNCQNGSGIGMFATRTIACGDLIIAHEDPIVATQFCVDNYWREGQDNDNQSQNRKNFCHCCATPLGTLRDHVTAASNSNSIKNRKSNKNNNSHPLPLLGAQNGPCYVDKTQLRKCHNCNMVICCSEACWEMALPSHVLICPGTNSRTMQNLRHHRDLQQFFHEAENPSIFQLALDAICLVVSKALEVMQQRRQQTLKKGIDSSSSSNHNKNDNNDNIQTDDDGLCHRSFLFWEDYGSHPLWWEVGNTKNQRKRLALSFANIVKDLLHWKIQKLEPPLYKQTLSQLDSIIATLCCLQNVGSLLGMLQCNVMEFEYPSPLEQYLEQLEIMQEEEEEDCEGKDTNIPSGPAKSWLEQYKEAVSVDNAVQITSSKGSGLYPLLTLANHDCDPNASIDFLQESNRGSMVALRDIEAGEEICITYIPNGDWDAGGTAARFRHFEPTRTWKWLNKYNSVEENDHEQEDFASDDDNACSDDGKASDQPGSGDDADNRSVASSVQTNEGDDADNGSVVGSAQTNEEAPEGHNQHSRQEALIEYGFQCNCKRCKHERENPEVPYKRHISEARQS